MHFLFLELNLKKYVKEMGKKQQQKKAGRNRETEEEEKTQKKLKILKETGRNRNKIPKNTEKYQE